MQFKDERYNRQEMMPQVGTEGQRLVREASVVSVGAGGVKSPLLYYLAAAGVGRIHIIDFDRIETSNLNRQILYRSHDVGRLKAEAAAEELLELNPEIDVTFSTERVDHENVERLLAGYSVILEGGDGPEQRLLCNSFAIQTSTPMVHVSAQYGYGYVFTMASPGDPCLQCAFPDLPENRRGPVPVWGVSTGLAGVLGANEVLKIILGKGDLASGYLFSFSCFKNDFIKVPIDRIRGCPACGSR
ncbi:HesA/MoeB/ThiF family protein [Microbacterium sp. NPDC055665]